eukprot:7308576-Prymnesium_polylepis.1
MTTPIAFILLTWFIPRTPLTRLLVGQGGQWPAADGRQPATAPGGDSPGGDGPGCSPGGSP